ncbi:hypothetical protein DCAR_0103941 [Daucus carota subsp. sativus]|uniref:Uncharacterized protein n=2 Tax=Daucus carota subsp. sativus TaxID=79200 RepID=A0AAF0W7M0_DAUCS|nr:hypothetical protein DCAR_0103941 [Daucus carota subsp. sativus]
MSATLCNLNPINYQTTQIITSYYSVATLSSEGKRSPCCCIASRVYRSRLGDRHIKIRRQYCWSSNSRAQHSEATKQDDVPRETLIWRAIKLPIYSVALVPITVGSAAAYSLSGLFSARRYLVILASSILIITWLNLSNDVYDFDTGADVNKKESVVNLVGSRTGTLIAAYLLLVLGFMGLSWASLEAGSLRSILLLASAVICGYIYQCPPFRLSYQGLGEPLCFAAFGPFATTAFYLLQSSTRELPVSGTILCASVLAGFTTTLILFCSHFHQINEDIPVGKLSPLVRLGTNAGSEIVKVAVVALYALLFAFGLTRALPFSSVLLCALTLPVGNLVVRFVDENHEDKNKIFMAKYFCVRLHTIFGAALAAGLVVARMIPGRLVAVGH